MYENLFGISTFPKSFAKYTKRKYNADNSLGSQKEIIAGVSQKSIPGAISFNIFANKRSFPNQR